MTQSLAYKKETVGRGDLRLAQGFVHSHIVLCHQSDGGHAKTT
jgi:hypothetical protein